MSKIFNVSGDCKPNLHYMVDIQERLSEIKTLIDKAEYFTINRARQYGKTTTLRALKRFLQKEYIVVYLDFQTQMSEAKFKNENAFSLAFAKAFLKSVQNNKANHIEMINTIVSLIKNAISQEGENFELVELFEVLSEVCRSSDKPIVLMIDEVDSAADNRIFLDFLAQLRGYYMDRDETPTFQSVILASVYDVKNLKQKIRTEEHQKEEKKKYNSPWNIAAEFDVNMSFSSNDILGMLLQYEQDYATSMDCMAIASLIYDYTSGYPFLVSKICKIIDEKIAGRQQYPDKKSAWTKEGVLEAVKVILSEKNTLFESMINKLFDYPELSKMIYELLFAGKSIFYNPDNDAIDIGIMFGFIKEKKGSVIVANRIFETRLYNFFLSNQIVQESDIYKAAIQDKNQFIKEGRLNMDLVMKKFVQHFSELYADRNEAFVEEDGRRYFLLYLRPIINGTGNYYIESRTRDMRRTDVIVDYLGEQFVIEMKIWHGEEYHHRGEEQLAGYLEDYHLKKGYLLSFSFNKKKQIGVREIVCGDKVIVEAVV